MLNPYDTITDGYLSWTMQLWDWKVPLLDKNPIILRSDVILVTDTSTMAKYIRVTYENNFFYLAILIQCTMTNFISYQY